MGDGLTPTERRLHLAEEAIKKLKGRFPKNARVRNLALEGHIHGPGGVEGTLPYDYVVDPTGRLSGIRGGFTTIQQALTQVQTDAADRTIFVVPGTYTEALTYTSSAEAVVHLIGGGYEATSIQQGNATILTINITVGSTERKGFIVEGFTFEDTTAGGTATSVLLSSNSSGTHHTFRGCKFFTGSGGTAIGYTGTAFKELNVLDCIFEGNNIGILGGPSLGGVLRVDHCFFRNIGIRYDGEGPVTISNCYFATTGIQFSTTSVIARNIAITGCIFEGGARGIDFDATTTGTLDGVSIAGCTFIGGTDGIRFTGAWNTTQTGLAIVGNTFDGCTQGIDFNGLTASAVVEMLTITGNSFRAGTTGIRGPATAAFVTNSLIIANTFNGFAANSAYTNWTGAGNQAFHNTGDGVPTETAHGALATIQEDDVTVGSNISTLDFTEPDATLVTESPAGEANINMALYGLLAGRAGGQTLRGGTAASENLTLQSTSHATRGRVIVTDDLRLTTGLIRDSGDTTRVQIGTTNTITGDVEIINATANALNFQPALLSTDARIRYGGANRILLSQSAPEIAFENTEIRWTDPMLHDINTVDVMRWRSTRIEFLVPVMLGASPNNVIQDSGALTHIILASDATTAAVVTTFPGDIRGNARLGIGVAPSNAGRVLISEASASINPTGAIYDEIGVVITGTLAKNLTTLNALRFSGTLTMAGFNSTNLFGLNFAPTFSFNSGASLVTNLFAVQAVPLVSVTGGATPTVTNQTGLRAAPGTVAVGMTTTTRRIIHAVASSGGGTLTTDVGLEIDAFSAAATNSYLIRAAGPTVSNLRLDAADPPDAASATQGDSQLFLAWMENGVVTLRQARWVDSGVAGAGLPNNSRVLIAA